MRRLFNSAVRCFLIPLLSSSCSTPTAKTATSRNFNSIAELPCGLSATRDILEQTASGITIVWTLQNSESLWRPAEATDFRYWDYLAWVKSHIQSDWKHVMQLQIDFLKSELRTPVRKEESEDYRATLNSALKQAIVIKSEKTGTVHPMNCLEAIPFLEFLKITNLQNQDLEEFFVTVLTREGLVSIVADLYRRRTPVSESEAARIRRSQLTEAGWSLNSQLHNHPFFFVARPQTQFGGNINPSDNDLLLYRELAPKTALITNGIDTLQMTPDEIDYLIDLK